MHHSESKYILLLENRSFHLFDDCAKNGVGQFSDFAFSIGCKWSDPGHQDAQVILQDRRILTLDQLQKTIKTVNAN